MNAPPDLRAVAERVVWFETAEETLRQPKRFLAYLMTFGTLEDILTACRYFSKQDFAAAGGPSMPLGYALETLSAFRRQAHAENHGSVCLHRVPRVTIVYIIDA
jgi:hypothetical protein